MICQPINWNMLQMLEKLSAQASFRAFADKPLLGLRSNLVGQLIIGLPWPD